MEPSGGIPNVSKSRCHQNLSKTVHRIKIVFVEKKINSATDWSIPNMSYMDPIGVGILST